MGNRLVGLTASDCATTSAPPAWRARLYWIHSRIPIAGRASAGGYVVSSSHICATTSPFSLMPVMGLSRPNWLKVTLPYDAVHVAAWVRAALTFFVPRLLT